MMTIGEYRRNYNITTTTSTTMTAWQGRQQRLVNKGDRQDEKENKY